MRKVFIVGAKRTAIGTFAGTLKDVPAVELGVIASRAAIEGAGVDPGSVDESVMGCILTANLGMGPGRQVSIGAGIPLESPGYVVNMLCGSGMKATMIGASDIRCGEAEVVLAGGMENMSLSPYMLDRARFGYKMGNGTLIDHMMRDGLIDVFNDYHMGVTAENLAQRHELTRQEQDEFALESQLRAKTAISQGKFKAEIAPVVIVGKRGETVFEIDEHPRETSLEALGKLRPAFRKDGTVTAGNASGINDGASATVLASEAALEKHALKPMAEIVAYSQAGVDPAFMGYGPVPAIEKVLKLTRLNIKDIGLFELNEAFAAQSLSVLKGLEELYGVSRDWMMERTNVNGGAIALGHPIGASGNRILVTLLYELKRRGLEYGLASLCIGGGMGTAMVIKNLQ